MTKIEANLCPKKVGIGPSLTHFTQFLSALRKTEWKRCRKQLNQSCLVLQQQPSSLSYGHVSAVQSYFTSHLTPRASLTAQLFNSFTLRTGTIHLHSPLPSSFDRMPALCHRRHLHAQLFVVRTLALALCHCRCLHLMLLHNKPSHSSTGIS